jgi:hypothetical protein
MTKGYPYKDGASAAASVSGCVDADDILEWVSDERISRYMVYNTYIELKDKFTQMFEGRG